MKIELEKEETENRFDQIEVSLITGCQVFSCLFVLF